jgi:hypothetical protein
VSGKKIFCKDARVTGLAIDLGDGVRTVAVQYTAEWAATGGAVTRFASLFTLMPGAAGTPPLVKNHVHRTVGSAGAAPFNIPESHKAVQDFAVAYIAAYDRAADGASRAGTIGFAYSEGAVMNYEGEDIAGRAGILDKLKLLPAAKHAPATLDVHPVSAKASLAMLTGDITLEVHPLPFIQALFVGPAPAGSPSPLIVVGDMFQFNYG